MDFILLPRRNRLLNLSDKFCPTLQIAKDWPWQHYVCAFNLTVSHSKFCSFPPPHFWFLYKTKDYHAAHFDVNERALLCPYGLQFGGAKQITIEVRWQPIAGINNHSIQNDHVLL